MIFFLKTQGGWRETVDVAVAPPSESQIDLSTLTDEELDGLMVYADKLNRAQEALAAQKDKQDGH